MAWIIGNPGQGTTTLVSTVIYNYDFLKTQNSVTQVLWIDMKQICPTALTPSSPFIALVNELSRLVLGNESHQPLETDSPISILKAYSVIDAINCKTRHQLETGISTESILIVIDSVTNVEAVGQVIRCLDHVCCIGICNSSENLMNVKKNGPTQLVLNEMTLTEMTEMLKATFSADEASVLAKYCQGSPLVASLVKNNVDRDAEILEKLTSLSNNSCIVVALLDILLTDNLFWRAFLLFEPGEAVDIDDLMVLWNCNRAEAERRCSDFHSRGLIRPLVDGQFLSNGTENRYRYYCVHSKVFSSALLLAAQRQNLDVVQKQPSELRFEVIYHALVAENGNVESSFHEAVRIGQRVLVEKILAIVESVDYFWKFSDYKLIIANLAEYFLQHACKTSTGINSRSNSSEATWLKYFARFLITTIRNGSRKDSVKAAMIKFNNNSHSISKFLQEVFIQAAACCESSNLLQLFFECFPEQKMSFLVAHEPLYGRTALMTAAMAKKSSSSVAFLLSPLLKTDSSGKCALTLALEHGNFEATEKLYNQTVLEMNLKNLSNEMVPLINAALSGSENVVNFVLRHRTCHIDATDDRKRTSLMAAAWVKSLPVAQMLLEAGANVNARDESGKTALQRAVENQQNEMVELLLGYGADPDILDKDRRTATILAVTVPNDDDGIIIKTLVSHGANLKLADRNEQTALYLAASLGKLECVQLILDHCVENINHQDRNGRSALMMACQGGYTSIARLLLERGADCNLHDKNESTSLMKAAEQGHISVCQVLLEYKSQLNATDCNGATALFLAAEYGQYECVNFLLQKVNSKITNNENSTILMAAVENGFFDASKKILEHVDTNVNFQNEFGQTALIMSSYRGDILITKLLLNIPTLAINIADADGQTALFMAAKNNHLAVFKLLIANNADFEIKNKPGLTCLLFSSSFGHASIVQYLLQIGASVNAIDNQGRTALMIAAKNGFFQVVKLLIDSKCEITSSDKLGRTALMRAASNGHAKICQFMLNKIKSQSDDKHRLFIEATDKHAKTALIKASENGHADVVKVLLDNGVEETVSTAVISASINGHAKVVRMLITSGLDRDIMTGVVVDALFEAIGANQESVANVLLTTCDIDSNVKDSNGNSALDQAAQRGLVNLFNLLLKRGAFVNVTGVGGATPLITATKVNQPQFVEELLKSGADVNASDDNGNTALMFAAKMKYNKLAEILLAARANPNLTNRWNESALLAASRSEALPIVKILIENGASPEIADRRGYTPILIAIWKNNYSLTQLLLDAGADVKATDLDGYNGLMIAARNKCKGIANLLVDHGIDVNFQNYHGYTALTIAVLKNDVGMARYLLATGANPNICDAHGRSACGTAKLRGSEMVALFNK